MDRCRTAGALVAVAALVAGCHRPEVTPTPTPLASPTVVSVGAPVAFHLDLRTGQRLTQRTPQPDGCPGFDATLTFPRNGYVRLAAYAPACDVRWNSKPGNGHHGVYRSASDVPADRLASAAGLHTALGAAVVFSQPYYECTNSCHNFTEPVAVITLDHPLDPAYPTLTAYAEKGVVTGEQLQALLRDQLKA